MTDLRTAAQQALEALRTGVRSINHLGGTKEAVPLHEAITALKAALEQSKPVEVMDAPLLLNGQPLYTHPPIERTLTDEKIAELWHQNGGFHHHFARAVERYLKGEK
jgi:hypothetical protein